MTRVEAAVGRVTALVGVSASGKTQAALQGCEVALRQGEPVLYVDADATLAVGGAQAALGCTDRFWLTRPDSAAEALAQAVCFCRQRVGGMVVIDSLDGLETLPVVRRRLLRLWLPRLVGAAYAGAVRVLVLAHPPEPSMAPVWPTYCFRMISLTTL